MRITAQLIDARSDTHLWSGRYDRELSDVLVLQSDVARAVAKQVRLELTPSEQAALEGSRPVDPQAHDEYLRALHLMGSGGLARVAGGRAIEHLQRAVELDPGFAEGHAQLARGHVWLAMYAFSTEKTVDLRKAREAAQRALELDDRQGHAYASLGMVRFVQDWDFPGASPLFERAVELAPSDPYVLESYAHYLSAVGRSEEALGISERLLRIAPLDLHWRARCGYWFFFTRRYDRALEEGLRIKEMDPDFGATYLVLYQVYLSLGRLDDAHRALITYYEKCGPPCDMLREALERGWAKDGWEGALRNWLAAVAQIPGFSPFVIGIHYALLGEVDQAFAWLERGYRERDTAMTALKMFPRSDPLRSDPRFDDLLRRIGFPES